MTTSKIITILIIVVVNTLLCFVLTKNTEKCSLHFGAYNVPFLINSFVFLQYTVTVILIWSRIIIINSSITNLVLKVNKNRTVKYKCGSITFDENDSTVAFRRICIIYSALYKSSKMVNNLYAEQLILTAVKVLFELLNSLYSIIKNDNELLVYYDGFWALIAILEIFFVLIPCSSAMRMVIRI